MNSKMRGSDPYNFQRVTPSERLKDAVTRMIEKSQVRQHFLFLLMTYERKDDKIILMRIFKDVENGDNKGDNRL